MVSGLVIAHTERKRIYSGASARGERPIENVWGWGQGCFGFLTALCCKEYVVWVELALPVVTSMQALDRKKELWYIGEKSYKMTVGVNVKEIDSFGNLVVFIPAQVRYNNYFENFRNLMFQKFGKESLKD